MFASVVLDIPAQSLDTAYTYAIPHEVAHFDLVGRAVMVPFGARQAIGFVLDVFGEDDRRAERLDRLKIKEIEEVVSESFFDEDGAACAQFIAHRYIAPLSSAVRLFTPPGGVPRVVHRNGAWVLDQPCVGEVDDRWATLGPAGKNFIPRKGSYKQEAVLAAVRQGDVRVSELTAELGSVSSCLSSLEKKDVVRIERRRRFRGVLQGACAGKAAGAGHETACASASDACWEAGGAWPQAAKAGDSVFRVDANKPKLNDEQMRALEAICAAYRRKQGEVVLVDGVTGSGKTEVYLRVIEQVLNEGENALVLVPEISLTPQTVARFRGRFGDRVAVMHSRMSQGERFDQWDFIRSGQARVVVGARSALFTPLPNVGAIIIDEEHEGSYKQDSQPRYHARDVACWQAARKGAVVVLGSATPSLEALYECAENPRWQKVELRKRANGQPMPRIAVVDMAKEFSAGHRSMFSRQLIKALRECLAARQKAVFMLNQRGFAKFLLCRDCGYVPTCDSCSTSLTYHEKGGRCVCHHCGYSQPAPAVCPECGSPYLKKFGAGTQRVESELKALVASFGDDFDDVDVIRMDADTTKTKGAHQRILEQFVQAPRAVLLGTQMIAKGLDFDDVTLVGVINADTTLHLPDFRAGERTFDLIEQVAGRAGRANLPGRVIVQTYDASTAAIQAAAHYDRDLLLEDELPKRELLGYPPYVRMANILLWGEDDSRVAAVAHELHADLDAMLRADLLADTQDGQVSILPATPCVLSKLKKMFRWHIVVACAPDFDLPALLEPFFRARKSCADVRISIDVDPQSLL